MPDTESGGVSEDELVVTPEQQAKINLVRLLVGDSEGNLFYPVLADKDYYMILELEDWHVMRAARRAATSIAFMFVTINYRERTSDIEVWNNASIEYRKVLESFLADGGGVNSLPAGLKPYVAGISVEDMQRYLCDPDVVRSPLAQISPCVAWWTRMENLPSAGCNIKGNVLGVCR